MENIETVILTKYLLKQAIDTNAYWKCHQNIVPFAKNKAKWLLRNERIEDDDVCAVLALNNDQLIAMVSLVPDWINTPDGNTKVYWSQRWWVHENYETSILSTYINQLSAESVNNKVIIKYIGTETIPYYKLQPYTEFSNRTRYIFVFDIDADLVISKLPKLKALRPLLRMVKKGSYYVISKINRLKLKTSGVSYKPVTVFNDEEWHFIKRYSKNDLVPKTKAYVEWQLDNLQYTKANALDSHQECLVTSISNTIYNTSFFILRDDLIIGFISALIRANEFVLRYFLCDAKHKHTCLDALMLHFIDSKCSFLLTENVALGEQLNKRFLNVYCNKTDLVALAHQDIDMEFTGITISEQDGHFA